MWIRVRVCGWGTRAGAGRRAPAGRGPGGSDWLVPVGRAGPAAAALGSLALILGVLRTILTMARNHAPAHGLAAAHPKFKAQHGAEHPACTVVAVATSTGDVRAAIGSSSSGVLAHYAMANAPAWTLPPQEGRPAMESLSSGWPAASSWPSPPVSSESLAAAYGVRRVVAARTL